MALENYPNLKVIVDNFGASLVPSGTSYASAPAYVKLVNAISLNPALAASLDALAANGSLGAVVVAPSVSGAGAVFLDGYHPSNPTKPNETTPGVNAIGLFVNTGTNDFSSSISETSLMNKIAHEAHHAETYQQGRDSWSNFNMKVGQAISRGETDYTGILKDRQEFTSDDEARAQIAAWNSAVDYEINRNPSYMEDGKISNEERNTIILQIENDFGNGIYYKNTTKGSDGKISFSNENIESVKKNYYFDYSTYLGHEKNQNYAEYYINGDIEYLLSQGVTDFSIDFKKLHINPDHIGVGFDRSRAGSVSITDKSTGITHTYDVENGIVSHTSSTGMKADIHGSATNDVITLGLKNAYVDANGGIDTVNFTFSAEKDGDNGTLMFMNNNGGIYNIIAKSEDTGKLFFYRLESVEILKFAGTSIDTTPFLSGGVYLAPGFSAEQAKLAFSSSPVWNHTQGFNNPPISPLILDMDGDGVEVSSLAGSTTQFDMNRDGFAERTAWVSPHDALLALDVNLNGRIDDGSELFGSNTTNGFAVLAAYDENHDGKIDASDSVFSNLLLWQDLNSDGISTSNELSSLSDRGIVSINLNASNISETNNGNQVTHRAVFTRADGTTGRVDDVWFKGNLEISRDDAALGHVPSAEAVMLPTLVHYGRLHNLVYAMDQDPALMTMVQDLMITARSGDMVSFRQDFESFMLSWAGITTTSASINGTSQPLARSHYDLLRVLHGIDPSIPTSSNNPGINQSVVFESEYQHAIDAMAGKFLSQVAQRAFLEMDEGNPLTQAFESTYFDFSTDTLSGDMLLAASVIGRSVDYVGIDNAGLALRMLVQTLPLASAARNGLISAALVGLSSSEAAIVGGYARSEILTDMKPGSAWTPNNQSNMVLGSGQNDVINAGEGQNVIVGGKGDDTITGGSTNDTIVFFRGGWY